MENNGFDRSEGDIPLPPKDTVPSPVENSVDVETASEPRVNAFPVTVELAECVVMKKSDVLRFSKNPYWIRIRTAFQMSVLVGWLALIGGTFSYIATLPRCKVQPELKWWEKTHTYTIYVSSFYDSDGDGVGDIKGIEDKLYHIKAVKAETIVLSSFYKRHVSSSRSNPGFELDITDHTDVDHVYGTIVDFDRLLKKAHDAGIKIVIDFIPNQTSDRHRWFTRSRASSDPKTNPFWNFYVWARCGGPLSPPNNWLSVYGNSSWSYDATRGECYLHQFRQGQPELNMRSDAVQSELERILRFWLDRGVDGFRVVNAQYMFEDADLRNEPPSGRCTTPSTEYRCLDHTYTTGLPDVYHVVARWRYVLDEYSRRTGRLRVLMTDADVKDNDTVKYYGKSSGNGAHLPINYLLTRLNGECGGTCVHSAINQWLSMLPEASTSTWLSGSADIVRVASRLSSLYVRGITLLKLLLPGVALTYYGEEIDMVDANRSTLPTFNHVQSPYIHRTPMQWGPGRFAEFMNSTTGSVEDTEPWLPLNEDFPVTNVMTENKTKTSLLTFYTATAKLRQKEAALHAGKLHYALVSENIFSFIRELDGKDRFLIAVNFGNKTSEDDYRVWNRLLPAFASVELTTSRITSLPVGQRVPLTSVRLEPGDGVVFRWPFWR